MQSLKAHFPNYIKSEIKFKEWKVKENSNLCKGSIIFTYEYESNGAIELEKYKSNLNEITVKQISNLESGAIIKNGFEILKYEKRSHSRILSEMCEHPTVIDQMCGACGQDLRRREENVNASISMVHDQPRIKVSEKEANDIGKKDLMNLVKNRKLVLLVDLDHTLIHTTNENVNPNLKEVYHYELVQKGIWYHTKFRPGCKKFLEEMSLLYELHMVTFGERNYAHTIANFMDPDRRYFHDRILSRNEIINPIAKTDNLKALFPRGDLMVCIIDDREDVWNYARNLICVQPYVYFKNTGDINDPHALASLSKSKAGSTNMRKRKLISTSNINSQTSSTNNTSKNNNSQTSTDINTSSVDKNDDDISYNSENSKDSSDTNGSTSSNNSKDSKKKDETINKNDSINKENEKKENDDDPDDYLIYLQGILKKIHDEYYDIYDKRLKSHKRNVNSNEINESDLPDVKKVIPLIKSRILENVVITFSGVVPVGTSPQYDLKKQRCYLMAKSLGAKVNENLILSDENNDNESIYNNQEEREENLISADILNSNQSSMIVKKNNRRYQYSFDDEYISNSSGGEFRSDDDEYEVHYYNPESDLEQNDYKSINKNKKVVKKKLKRHTTHLVAAKHGTSKVHDALKSKLPIKVVTPEWLIDCNFKWAHCNEDEYKLTKEYDYRTCIFHQEYNMHQKYSSNSKKSTINPNNSSLNSKRSDVSFRLNPNKYNESNKTDIKEILSLKKNESTDSLSSLEVKTKKRKSNEEKEKEISSEKLALNISPINEEIFQMMDKEVNEELDDTDEDDDDLADDESDSSNSRSSSSCSSSKSNNNDSCKGAKNSNKIKSEMDYDLSEDSNSVQFKSGPRSVSSTSSNNSSIDSIDDEFGLELERDLKK